MKRTLFVLLLLSISFITFSQEKEDEEPKLKKPYVLKDVNFHYSGAIFNFNSTYLDHMHSLYDYTSPQWPNMDSTTKYNNRSEVYGRMCWQKQLKDSKSSFFGNIYLGIGASFGDRLDAAYMSEYKTHLDSSFINSEPVTNLDTVIITQAEYVHNSTDIGFDIAYTIGSTPKNTFTGEFGIGLTTMYSIISSVSLAETESRHHNYVDQYNRIQNFDQLDSEITNFDASSQLILKAYVPIILSYKLNRSGSFALTTMLCGGIELQKPAKSQFFAYPYFTIGVGCRFYIK